MRRRRKSSIPPETVRAISRLVREGWATDDEIYPTRSKATAKSQAYRRAIAEELGVDASVVTTRVWEESPEQYRFALTVREPVATD